MQVSLETTSGLERKLTVGVPASVVDEEVTKRLQQAAKTVRINGFRKGKVPIKVVKQRYGANVRQEVLGDTINRTFYEAVQKEAVNPAGPPAIEPKQIDEGKDIEYVATFEVYPEIELHDIEGIEIEKVDAEITDADVDQMIETLQDRQATWGAVERAAADKDLVNIDFVGTKDGEEFNGGAAKGHDLELGSNSMIPGFEEGIVGMKAGETKTLALTFPEDYHVDELKGAAVEFAVTANKVSEKKRPELDDELFKTFGVDEGGLDAFKKEVRENMELEKTKLVKGKLKVKVLDVLLEKNQIDVPNALVTEEIKALRQQTLQQYGQLNTQLDVASLLPDDLFRERATRRTALGLLISEVVKQEKVEIDDDRLKQEIETLASTYEDPQSVINYYYSNQELLNSAKASVMEDQVVDLLLGKANVVEKTIPYQDLIKPEENPAEKNG